MAIARSQNLRSLAVSALAASFLAAGCGAASDDVSTGEELGETTAALRPNLTPSAPADFDILQFGLDGHGDPRLKVAGKAGGTRPTDPNTIYAYVFVTDQGLFAVASHEVEDSTEVTNDLEWHAHKVTLDENNCISGIEETGDARLHGNKVEVRNTGATSVSSVLTVQLNISDAGICVTRVFDSL
jgi:hypothetical protein